MPSNSNEWKGRLPKSSQKNQNLTNPRTDINHEHSKSFGQIGFCKVS